jgi:hypothetical protein
MRLPVLTERPPIESVREVNSTHSEPRGGQGWKDMDRPHADRGGAGSRGARSASAGEGSVVDGDSLRAWIREHRVCWELSPRYEVHEHRLIQVGFELALFARQPDTFEEAPGSEACRRHYEMLREVALAALPKDAHSARCELEPFDASVHLRRETSWALELELKVLILRRDATFGNVDQDERRYAEEIQEALRRLGAQPRTWSDTNCSSLPSEGLC